MKLTPHFDSDEFLVSKDYPELAETMTLSPVELERVGCFYAYILEPLRRVSGGGIVITNGKRSPELNRKVGGHPNSHHMMKEDHIAADIYSLVLSPEKLSDLIEKLGLPVRYYILYDTFVHISGPDSSGIYGQFIDKRGM